VLKLITTTIISHSPHKNQKHLLAHTDDDPCQDVICSSAV
jgi:hypothetical protein